MLEFNLMPCIFGSKELTKSMPWTINIQKLVKYLTYKFRLFVCQGTLQKLKYSTIENHYVLTGG